MDPGAMIVNGPSLPQKKLQRKKFSIWEFTYLCTFYKNVLEMILKNKNIIFWNKCGMATLSPE